MKENEDENIEPSIIEDDSVNQQLVASPMHQQEEQNQISSKQSAKSESNKDFDDFEEQDHA